MVMEKGGQQTIGTSAEDGVFSKMTTEVWWNVSNVVNLDNATADENILIPHSPARNIALTVVFALLILVVVVGNCVVILAVYYEHNLRSVTYYYIVSLAVADLLLGVIVLPISATYKVMGYWIFGPKVCFFWCAFDVFVCTASICNLMVISLDRYLAISRPMRYPQWATPRLGVFMIAGVWVLSMVVSLAPLFGFGVREQGEKNQCNLTGGMGYVIFSASGSFFVPLPIILFTYYRIYVLALHHTRIIQSERRYMREISGYYAASPSPVTTRTRQSQPNGAPKQSQVLSVPDEPSLGKRSSTESNKSEVLKKMTHVTRTLKRFGREKRAAKTLAIVVGCFVICWFPFFTIYLVTGVCESCSVSELTFDIVFWLGYCNSCFNPFIYPLSNREFRRGFRKLYHRLCCLERSRGGGFYTSGSPTSTRGNTVRLAENRGGVRLGVNLPDAEEESQELHIIPASSETSLGQFELKPNSNNNKCNGETANRLDNDEIAVNKSNHCNDSSERCTPSALSPKPSTSLRHFNDCCQGPYQTINVTSTL